MTLCLRRMMSVYVPSVWNFSPNCSNTWLNLARLPVLTAEDTHRGQSVMDCPADRCEDTLDILTLSQQEVGHQRPLEGRLSELESVRNLSQ